MLPSFDKYLHAKNLKNQLIPSRDINDQRISQSDWTKGTIGHIQTKVVVLDAASP